MVNFVICSKSTVAFSLCDLNFHLNLKSKQCEDLPFKHFAEHSTRYSAKYHNGYSAEQYSKNTFEHLTELLTKENEAFFACLPVLS